MFFESYESLKGQDKKKLAKCLAHDHSKGNDFGTKRCPIQLVFLKKDSLTFVKTVLTSRAGENRAMPPAMLRPVMYSLCPGISSWILAKPYSMRYTWVSMSMSAITYCPSSANCAPAGRLATQWGKSGSTDCTNARSVDVYTK